MTARERAELESLVSPVATVLRAGLFLLAVTTIGWILAGLQEYIGQAVGRPIQLPLWLLPTVMIGLWLYIRAGQWTGGRRLRAQVRRDLERGELAHHRVRVMEALEAPEIEDEGPVFFVREADGTTLFFGGQEMARYKGRGFPWSEFEITESPESRRFFRLRPVGGSFPEVQQRAPLGFAEAKELGVFTANFGVVDLTLEQLAKEA